MRTRLYTEGILTTILGIAGLVFSAVMIYTGKATAGDMAGWIATSLLFLRSKDSLIGIK